ncbi:hypothetical protein YC2023_117211 [Brassica napus]
MTTSLSFKSNQDESRCDPSFPVWEYDNFFIILIKPGRIGVMNRDVILVFLFGNMTTSLSFKSNQDESRCDPSFPVWEYDNFFIILIKPGRIGVFPVWEYDNFFAILIKTGRIAIFPVWEYDNFFVILIKPGRIAMMNRDVIPVFLFGNMTTSLSFKSNQDESRCDPSFPVWEYDNFFIILIKPGRIGVKNRDDESRCDPSFPVWEYDNLFVILIKPGRIAMMNRDVIPVFLFGNMTTSLSFKSNQDESRCDPSFPVWEYDNFFIILIKPGRIGVFPVWEYDNFFVILIKPGRIAMMNRDVIPVFMFGNMTTILSFKSNQDESRCDPSFPVWEYDNFFIILIKPGRIGVFPVWEYDNFFAILIKTGRIAIFPVWEYDNFFVILIKPGRIAMMNRDVIPVFLFGNMTTSLSFKSNQDESRCYPSFPVWEYDNFFIILIKPGRIGVFPVWEYDNFFVILIKPGRIAMMNRDVISAFLFGNMTTSLSFKSNQDESRCDPSFPVWEYDNFFIILIKPRRIGVFPVWEYDNFFAILIKTGRIAIFPVWEYDNFFVILIKPGRIAMMNRDEESRFILIKPGRIGNMTTSLSFKSNQDESRCDPSFPVWEYDNFFIILIKPGRIGVFPVWEYDNFFVILIKPGRIAMMNREVIPVFLFGNMTTSLSFKSNQDESRCDPSFPVWEYDNVFIILIKPGRIGVFPVWEYDNFFAILIKTGRIAMKNRDDESRCDLSFPVWEYDNLIVILIKPGRIAMMNRDVIPVFLFGNMTTSLSFKSNQDESRCDPSFPVWEYDNFIVILIKPGRIAMKNRDEESRCDPSFPVWEYDNFYVILIKPGRIAMMNRDDEEAIPLSNQLIPVFLFGNMTTSLSFKSNQDESRCDPSFPVWEYDNFIVILIKPGRIAIFPIWEYDNFSVILIKPGRIAMKNRDVIPVFQFGNITTSLSFKSNQDESRCDLSFPVWEYDNFFVILIKPGRIAIPGRIAMMNRDEESRFILIKPGRIGNMTTSLSFKSNQDESRCDPSFPVWEYDNFFIILIKPGRIGVMNREVIPVFLFGNMTTSLSFKSNQDESRCDPSFPVWEYDNVFIILIKPGRIGVKNRDDESRCDLSFPVWEYDNLIVILIKPGRIAMMNRDDEEPIPLSNKVISVFLFGNMTTSLSFKSNQDESRCDPSFPVWEYDNFFIILIKPGRIGVKNRDEESRCDPSFPVWEYDNFFVILIKPGRIAMMNRDEELGCDPSFPVWEYDNFFVILIKPGRIAMKNRDDEEAIPLSNQVIQVFLFGNMTTSLSFKSNQDESRCDPSFPVWEYDNFFAILIKTGRIAMMNRDVIPVFLFGNMTTSLSFKSNQDESRCDPSFPVWEYDNFIVILIKPGRIAMKNRDEESRCDPSFPVWEYDNFYVILIKPGRIAMMNRDDEEAIPLSNQLIPVFLFGNMTTSLSFKSNQDESRCDPSFPVWEYDNFIVILIKPGRIAIFPIWEYDNFSVILIKPGIIAMKNRDEESRYQEESRFILIKPGRIGNMTTSLSFKSNQDESRCDPSFPVWEYDNFFIILIKPGRIGVMNREVIPVFLFGNMTTSLSFKSNQDESRCDPSFPVWEYDNVFVILIKPGRIGVFPVWEYDNFFAILIKTGRIAMKNRDEELGCDPSFPIWEYDNFFVILIKPGRIAMMNREVIPVFLFGNMTTSLSFKSNQDESRCDPSFPVWEYDNVFIILIKPGRIGVKNRDDESRCDLSFPVWEYDNLIVILIKPGRIAMMNRDEELGCDPSFPVWEYDNFFAILIKPGRIAMKNRDEESRCDLSFPVWEYDNLIVILIKPGRIAMKNRDDESRCDLSFPVWEYDNLIVILIKPGRIAMKNWGEESRCDPSFPVWEYDNFFVILIKPGRIAMKNRDEELGCDPSFPVWEYDNFFVILIKPGRIAMKNRDDEEAIPLSNQVIQVFLFGNMTTSLSFKSNQDESRCDPSFPVWEYDNFFAILIKTGRIAMMNRDVIPVFLFGNMTTSLSFKSNQDESRCDPSFPVWEYDNFIVILIKPGRIAMKNRDEESRCDPSFPVWEYDNFYVILIKPGRIAMKNWGEESRCDPSFPVWEYDNFFVILIKPGRIAMKNRDEELGCDPSFPVWEYDNFFVILIKPGRIAMKNRDDEEAIPLSNQVIQVFLFGNMTTSLSFKSNQDESRCDPSFPVWEYDNFFAILIKTGRIAMMNRDVIPVFLFGNMTTSLSFKSNQDESRCDPSFPVWEYDNFIVILIKPGRIAMKNRDEESRCDPSFPVWEYDNFYVILIKPGRIAMMNRDDEEAIPLSNQLIPVFLFGNMTTSLSFKSNQDESRCDPSFPVWEYDNFIVILIKPGRIAIFPIWEYDNFSVILIKPGRIAMKNRDVIPVFQFGNITTSLSFKSNQDESRCDLSFPVWEYDNFFVILIKPGRIAIPGRIAMMNREVIPVFLFGNMTTSLSFKSNQDESRCDPSFPVWEYDNVFIILIKPGRIGVMNREVIPVFLFGNMTTSLSFKSNQDESRCDPSFPVWEYDNVFIILIKPGRIGVMNREVIPVFLFGNMTTSLSFKSNQDESRCDPSFPVWEYDNVFIILIKPGRIGVMNREVIPVFLFGNMTTSLSFKSNQDESRCDPSFPVWEYDNVFIILIKPGRIGVFPVWEYDNFFAILIKTGRIAMKNRDDESRFFLFGNMTTSLSFKSNQDESRCDPSFPVWEYDNFIVILIKPGRIAMMNRDEESRFILIKPGRIGNMTTSLSFKSNQDESRCDPSFPVWEYDNFFIILIKPGRIGVFPVWEYDNFFVILIKPGRIAMMNREVIPVFLFGNMTTSLSFKSNQDESRCDPSFPVWEYDNVFIILIKPGRIGVKNRDEESRFILIKPGRIGNMTTSLSFKSNQDESRCDPSFLVWEYDNFFIILIKPGRIGDPSFPVWEYDNFFVILIKPGRIAMMNREVIPVFLFGNMTTSLSFKSNQDESRCDPSFPVWEYDNVFIILIKPGRIGVKNRDDESRCDPSFPVWEYDNVFIILIKPGRIGVMNREVIPVFLFGNMTTSLSFKSNQDESRCDPSFPVWEYDNVFIILIKPGRIGVKNRDDESRCDLSFPVWEYDNLIVIQIKPGRIAMMNRDEELGCDPSFPVWEYDNFFAILIKTGRIAMKNRDDESRCDLSFPVWEYDNLIVIQIKPGRIAMMNRDVIPVFLFRNMTTSLSFKSNQDESLCDPSFPVWEYDNVFIILIKPGRIGVFPVWEYDNFFAILIKTGRIAMKNRDDESRCDPSFPVWEYDNFFVILIKPGRIAMMNRDVIPVFLFGNMTTSLSFKSNQDESRCDSSFPVWEYDNVFIILIKPERIGVFPVWEYDNFSAILIKTGRIVMKNRDVIPVFLFGNITTSLSFKSNQDESRCDPSFPVWEYDNFFVILIKPGRIAMKNSDVIPVILFGNMTTSLSFKSNQDESRCDPSFPVWEYDNFFIILIKPGRIGVMNRDVIPVFLFGNMTTSLSFKSNQDESRCDPTFPVWEYDNFFIILIKPGRIGVMNRDVIPVFLFGNMTTSLSFKSNQDESRCDPSFPVWENDNFFIILIKPGRIRVKNRDDEEAIPLSNQVIPVFLFGNMTTSLSFKSNQEESRCDPSFPVWEYDNFFVILIKTGRIAMKNRDEESRCDPSFPVWEYDNFFVILIKTGRIAMKNRDEYDNFFVILIKTGRIAMMNRDVIPVFLFGNMTTSLSFKSNQDESRCDPSFPVWENDNFFIILIKPGRIRVKNRDEESRCDPSFPVWEYDNFFVILIKPGRIAMMNRDVIPVFLFGNMTTSLSFKSNQDESRCDPSFPVWEYDNFFAILIKTGRIAMMNRDVIPVFLFGNMTTSLSFKSNQDESRCDPSFPVWENDNFFIILIKPGRIRVKNRDEESRCDPSFPVWEYDNFFVILIKPGRIAMMNRDDESRCDPTFPVWEYDNFIIILIKPGRIGVKNRDDEEAIPLSNQVIPVFLFRNMTTSLSFKSNQDESRCDLSFPVWEYDNFIVILIKPGRIAMKNSDVIPVFLFGNMTTSLSFKSNQDESRCDPSFPVWEYDNFFIILIKPGRIGVMNRDVIPVFLFGNITTSLSFKSNQDESRCDPTFPVWEYDNFFIILIKPGRIGVFPVWEYDNFIVILIKPGRIAM